MRNQCYKAFSLIELLCCITLLSIFALVAMPAFGQWIQRNHIESQRDLLHTQLNQARATSVLHNRDVDACGSSNGLTCDNQWNHGWLLHYPDTNQLISQQQLTSEDHLRWAGARPVIRFHSNGTSPLGNGRFYLCDASGKVVAQIVISRQGRLRQVAGLEPNQNPTTRCH
ncbi:MAG: hypothetical protein A2Y50_12210 [Pseudomonadales bacterium RIFCSPLOWO2_12_59_9]|nr:MAG: hypothetical protein A2Y50_12210 [Pseudomonadales bacterium RIFCSPLOWO2_12_59_9]